MSYRSDVRINVSKKGFKELTKYVRDYLGGEYNLLDHLDKCIETNYEKYFGWNNIKWYEFDNDFKSVKAIREGLDYLEENGYSYRFSRLGESYDDYDEQYFDGEKDEDIDLEYPSLLRQFDDEYAESQMRSYENYIDKEDK